MIKKKYTQSKKGEQNIIKEDRKMKYEKQK